MAESVEAAIDTALMAGAEVSDINTILGRTGRGQFSEVPTAEISGEEGPPTTYDSSDVDYLEQALREDGGEAPQAMDDDLDDFYNSIPGTVAVDNSALGSFKKGWHEGSTLVGNIGDIAEAYTGGLGGVRLLDSEYHWSPGFFSSEDMYGKDWGGLTYEDRRKRILDVKKERIQRYYGDIEGGGMAGFTGSTLKALADPSSLLPIGQTYKAAAAIGAGIGGVDAIAMDLAQKGEIDLVHVAMFAGAGAVIAPALLLGGNKFAAFLSSRTESDIPITGVELLDEMKAMGITDRDMPDVDAIAAELNNHYELKGEGFWQSTKDYAEQIKRGDVIDKPLDGYIFDTRMEALRPNAPVDPKHAESLKALEKKWNMTDLYISDEKVKFTADKMRIRMRAEMPEGPDRVLEKKPTEKDSLTATPAEYAAMTKKMDDDGQLADDFIEMANPVDGGFAIPEITDSLGSQSLGALTGHGFPGLEGRVFGDISGLNMPHTSSVGAKMDSPVGELEDPALPITAERGIDLAKKAKSGELRAKPETAFQSWGPAGKLFGELFKRTNEDLNMSLSRKLMDAENALYQAGVKQKNFIFDKDMPGYSQIGGILNKTIPIKDADPMAVAASKEFQKILTRSIDDSVAAKIITSERGAKLKANAKQNGYWPRVYNEFYMNSKAGRKKWIDTLSGRNWSEEEMEKLINVIDAPTKLQREAIARVAITPGKRKAVKAAVGAIEKITGSAQLKRAIKEGKIVKKGKVYRMPARVAEDIWTKRKETTASSRSMHLERERKIPLPDDVLAPFLVDDPMTVLSDYLRDVYKRVHMAQRFGRNDEIAEKLFSKVGEEIGPRYQKEMQEVYYTMAGDADTSETIKAFTNLNPTVKDAISRVTAFETLKLSMASIANSAQALVNGTVALERLTTSPAKTVIVHAKAVKNTLSKEGREFALRSGAAAESTMLQVMGDITAHDHSIFHGTAKGIFKPLNYINQPAKFLKSVGYVGVEKVQRIYGANLGRALIEQIRDDNIRLIQKKAMRGLNKKEEAKLAKNKRTFSELGINPEVDPTQISVSDLSRASQRFSNEINFAGSPDQMPIYLQRPMVKPFFQFKSFIVKHSAFVIKNTLKPIKDNPTSLDSYRPLAAYLTVGTATGMGLDEFRRFVSADDKEMTMTKRVLRGHSAVGGMGIMYDMSVNALYSPSGLLNWFGGPGPGELSNLAFGVSNSIVEQSMDPLYKQLWGVLPPFPLKEKFEEDLMGK